MERLLLARAYHERDFPDRARNLLGWPEEEKRPEFRTLLGRTLRPAKLPRELGRATSGWDDDLERTVRRP